MDTKDSRIGKFIKDLMKRRRLLPSQLASDIGISHSTVKRWLTGEDIPSTRSCRKLAKYSNTSLYELLSMANHLPETKGKSSTEWPHFREYALNKYPDELDEDLITMIEDLIERRRARNRGRKSP